MRNNENMLLTTCWVTWAVEVEDTKKLRQLQLQEKAKRSEVAMQSLTKLCHSQDAAALGMCMSAWQAAVQERNREKRQAEQDRLAEKQEARLENSAACFQKSSQRMSKVLSFQAWQGEVVLARQSREAQAEEEKRRNAGIGKFMAKLCGSQAKALEGMCFTAWCKVLEDRQVEARQAEKDRLQRQKDTQREKLVASFAHSSKKGLCQGVFVAWTALCSEEKLAKRLRMEEKNRRSEVATKSLAKFLASEAQSCKQVFFGLWRKDIEDRHTAQANERLSSMLAERAALENDRILHSVHFSRLAAWHRARRAKSAFWAWYNLVCVARNRPPVSPQGRQGPCGTCGSPSHRNVSYTTVGQLLATASKHLQRQGHA